MAQVTNQRQRPTGHPNTGRGGQLRAVILIDNQTAKAVSLGFDGDSVGSVASRVANSGPIRGQFEGILGASRDHATAAGRGKLAEHAATIGEKRDDAPGIVPGVPQHAPRGTLERNTRPAPGRTDGPRRRREVAR